MTNFTRLAGRLSIFFVVLLVASTIVTGAQWFGSSQELERLDNEIRVAQSKLGISETQLELMLNRREETVATLARLTERCVTYNIEEGVSESRAAEYCETNVGANELASIDDLTERAEDWQSKVLENQVALETAKLTREPELVAQRAALTLGVSLGVSLIAVGGAFRLAYLWGVAAVRKEGV